LTDWCDPDVVGIGLGIVALMTENYRTQLVEHFHEKSGDTQSYGVGRVSDG
jgi:hypothetical protein